ncbi:hypothetical protein BK140_32205 [Paenibacillus macerans]|nr:hypothetical protein BK140_32205 [Paenibacillus macerans]
MGLEFRLPLGGPLPRAITQEAARFLKNTGNYKIISEVEDEAQVERGGEEESLTKPAFVTRMVAG